MLSSDNIRPDRTVLGQKLKMGPVVREIPSCLIRYRFFPEITNVCHLDPPGTSISQCIFPWPPWKVVKKVRLILPTNSAFHIKTLSVPKLLMLSIYYFPFLGKLHKLPPGILGHPNKWAYGAANTWSRVCLQTKCINRCCLLTKCPLDGVSFRVVMHPPQVYHLLKMSRRKNALIVFNVNCFNLRVLVKWRRVKLLHKNATSASVTTRAARRF